MALRSAYDGNGEMAGEGKSVGIVGGILAAIGAAFAHGADDCARTGARVGAHAGDDIARPAAIAPRALAESSDDLGRGASRLGAPAVVDDSVRAAPSEQLVEELGQEASLQALDLMLDETGDDSEETEIPALSVPRALHPTVVSLVSAGAALDNPRWSSVRARSPSSALAQAASANSEIVLILGYVEQAAPDQLLTVEGALGIPRLEQDCARKGRRCIVLACEGSEREQGSRSCARSSLEILNRALESAPKNESELLRHLLADRAQSGERRLTLHRLVVSGKKLRLVHSRLD